MIHRNPNLNMLKLIKTTWYQTCSSYSNLIITSKNEQTTPQNSNKKQQERSSLSCLLWLKKSRKYNDKWHKKVQENQEKLCKKTWKMGINIAQKQGSELHSEVQIDPWRMGP